MRTNVDDLTNASRLPHARGRRAGVALALAGALAACGGNADIGVFSPLTATPTGRGATATPLPPPTATRPPTNGPGPTTTFTAGVRPTRTPQLTPSATPPLPTQTSTAMLTRTATAPATSTSTPSPPRVVTATVTPTNISTHPPTASATASPSATLSATQTSTPLIPTLTVTQLASPTVTGSATVSATNTPITASTDTPSPTATNTAVPTATKSTGAATSTPTPSATPSPLATPTGAAAVCDNGIIEAGETCTSCPGDCTVLACTATTPIQTFRVDFQAPAGSSPSALAALVGYRSNRVSLPGNGSAAGSRIKGRPSGTSQLVNDLNYAVRVLIQAQAGVTIPTGKLFTVDFDSCQGATPVSAADFGCAIESCGSSFGPIDGCTCTVSVP